MNEKLQYATMLEIPVNTCSVTFTPSKRKKSKRKKSMNHEAVKEELMNKINAEQEQNAVELAEYNQPEYVYQDISDDVGAEQSFEPEQKEKKGGFKFSIIGAQLCVVGILIAAIFLTNAFYPDSGINVFMRGVFGVSDTEQVVADDRLYNEFAPVISISDGTAVEVVDGVINMSGEGSIYAPCNGKVTSLVLGEDGKYTMEITHSENFKTVLSGIDYAYAGLDGEVFYNIPVGYTEMGEIEMCFIGENGAAITNYELVDNSVVWAV
jgi:hypothetical protein